MARWTAKEMVLNVSSTEEAILLLEAIQKQIKKVDIVADYNFGKINIRFEGTKDQLKEAVERAKYINQTINGMLYTDADGFYDYEITYISKAIGKSVPVKILLRILELQGIESSRDENILYSKIEYNPLVKLINAIDTCLSSMPYEVSTKSLREVLTTIAVVKNLTVEKALALARKAKTIGEDEYKRLILSVEPSQAIDKCLKIAK
ncbi:MAG: DUF2067 family protein [Candidatus Heimdallarchaeota archaeon]